MLQTDRLGEVCPGAAGSTEIASGVIGFALMNDRSELVAWFRSELVQAVDWGGDPHNAKLAATEGDHVRLSPRRSFDLWRETIRGRAEPWDDSAVQAAQRFTRHLGAALLRYERDSASLARDLQRVMRPGGAPVAARVRVLGVRPVGRPRARSAATGTTCSRSTTSLVAVDRR